MTEKTKIGQMCWGVSVDGVSHYLDVTLEENEEICPECEGQAAMYYDYGKDGFQKLVREVCQTCNGKGTITLESEEDTD